MRLAYFITYIALTAACSSNAPVTTNQAIQGQGEWFCQIAEDSDEWQCVQDDELAANPRPQRLPHPPEPEPAATPEAAAPEPRVPEPPSNETARAQPASATTTTQRVTVDNTASRPVSSTLPKYARLAYTPDRVVGLMDLPADFYAVQLVAVSSKEALEQYAEDHGLRGMSAARVANGDRLFYVLLLGIYETQDIAEEAIVDIPPPLDELNFWIRSMGSLQRAMLAGNLLAGTDEV